MSGLQLLGEDPRAWYEGSVSLKVLQHQIVSPRGIGRYSQVRVAQWPARVTGPGMDDGPGPAHSALKHRLLDQVPFRANCFHRCFRS